MRLTGFASGLDLNQMVSDLMKAQRMPLNKLTQQKTLLEWKRDSYRDVNKLLTEFSNLSFDMTLQRSYSQKAVTTSNSQKVSATAPPTATNGTYTISNISPATNAYNFSEGAISGSQKVDLTKSIWEQRGNFDSSAARVTSGSMWKTENVEQREIELKGQSIKLDKGAIHGSSFPEKLFISEPNGEEIVTSEFVVTFDPNEELTGNKVFINRDTGEVKFNSEVDFAEGSKINSFSYNSYYSEFKITTYNQNGEAVVGDFRIEPTDSLNSIITKINNSDVGVTAFYDEGTDKIMFTRKETGDFNPMVLDETTGEYVGGKEMELEGLFLTNVLKLNEANEEGGEKATFTLNGMPTERNSNSFNVNGITFNLHEATTDPVTITVNNDTDKTFDTIKNYVDKYNELIEKLNGMISEPVYRDYKPLSDDERETLSEKQQEQWEERARSGLLRNDSIISSALNQMRTAFYSTINTSGDIKQLAQLGITTSTNYREKGKLQINEAKLREAIANDPNAVMELFTKEKGEDGSQGIARSLRETVQGTIRNIEARAGNSARTNQQFTIGREMINLDQRISSFEQRMQRVEERYWRQFTAMEKAIQQSNSQSTQLMSYFYQ